MKYNFLTLTEEVLNKSETALSIVEIWQQALVMGLDSKIQSKGKTPWQTDRAQLYLDIKNNECKSQYKNGSFASNRIYKKLI